MESIQVGYRLIENLSAGPLPNVYHKYIIYTNSFGSQWVIRGGPSVGNSFDASGTIWGGTDILMQVTSYVPGAVDWDAEGDDPRETVMEGKNLSQEFATMKIAAKYINNEKVPYVALNQNSNSAVDTVLAVAGVPAPTLDDQFTSPGSDNMVMGALDPLLFDFAGDGLNLSNVVHSTTLFDLDSDGTAEQVGWVQPGSDDGFLAWDRDGNGAIESGKEIFVEEGRDAFAVLADYDDNLDGVIDRSDAVFAELLVWIDSNGDGVSDTGELQSLFNAGIQTIDLSYDLTGRRNNFNLEHAQSTATTDDGASLDVYAVFLAATQSPAETGHESNIMPAWLAASAQSLSTPHEAML